MNDDDRISPGIRPERKHFIENHPKLESRERFERGKIMRRSNFYLLFTISILLLFSSCSEVKQTGKENKKNLTDENWLMVSGDQIVNQKGDAVYLRP